MKQLSTQNLVKEFKKDLLLEKDIKIDFRSDVFLENQHGLSPCFNYSFAETVVTYLYDWAHQYIEDHEENYPSFSGWEYNTAMECDKLRTSKLKTLIQSVCHELFIHHVETFRKEGNKVFKYSKEHNAYLFDHVDGL